MSGGKGGGSVVVGYWYFAGMHLVLCHSADAITEVIVGERTAWTGNVTANGRISINKPELFGGKDREGGVVGGVDLMFGGPTQTPNDYLAAKCAGGPAVSSDWDADAINSMGLPGYNITTGGGGGTVPAGVIPAFRGVVSAVLRQVKLSAMNPYIKPWRFRVKRIPKPLGATSADIGSGNANPAYIVAECLLNAEWGMGYGTADLDTASFTAAAATLAAENFGLSLTWDQQSSIEDFLAEILQTIDGVLYLDMGTGKFKLRLIRNDYDPATILALDQSAILNVERYSRPGLGELQNQVTLTYTDRASGKEKAVTVQDIASINQQGGVSATSIRYRGIPNGTLAQLVAMRELAQLSRGPAKATIIANRKASKLKIGDVFKMTWPALGITSMVMRVVGISYGLLADGRVKLEVAEDIFSMPSTSYLGSDSSSWQDPAQAPANITASRLLELPYYLVVQQITTDSDTALADLPAGYGYLSAMAGKPQAQALGFDLLTLEESTSRYIKARSGGFTPYGTLSAAVSDTAAQFPVAYADLANFAPNEWAILDEEIVQVTGINDGLVSVVRGVLDTVPAAHSAGAVLYFGAKNNNPLYTTYLDGQEEKVKLLNKTPSGIQAESGVAFQSITFSNRAARPYPPGNVRLNDSHRPTKILGPLASIKWAHRNRLTQTAGYVAQTAGTITPEAGTTYDVTLYKRVTSAGGWTTVYTATGLTGEVATVGGGGTFAAVADACQVKVEIKSKRDGLYSHQTQTVQADLAGYGFNYGNYYGGF